MASMVEFLANVAGVMRSFFQIGGPTSPGLNANGTALETKNAGNTAFAVMRAAPPVLSSPNDLTTQTFVNTDGEGKPFPTSLQFSGANPLPANTATQQYYVVTTTGPNASIGQLLYDDGSGVGTVTVIPALVGLMMITTAAFVGGTIVFNAFSLQVWTGASWQGAAQSVPGAMQVIQFPIAGANVSSVTALPPGAQVFGCLVAITTPYPAAAFISVGQPGTPTLLQDTTDNSPTVVGVYNAKQVTTWGAAATQTVLTTILNGGAGAGTVTVLYTVVPNP